ncbi:MAG: amidohydrolase family protein [Peptococcaceae bacterium]|nr:amidohydrolase family protein [Peptococcaceae bacterium]
MGRYDEELAEFIGRIPVVDTHEHFCFPHCLKTDKRNILSMIQGMYITDDLRSAGFGSGDWAKAGSPEEKWRAVRAGLRKTRNTTYYKVLKLIFRELYQVEDDILTLDYAVLSRYTQESAAKGEEWYDYVLGDRANIQVSLLDKGQTTNFELWLLEKNKGGDCQGGGKTFAPEKAGYHRFKPVFRTDFLSFGYLAGARTAVFEKFGIKIETFEEYEAFLAELMSTLKSRGFYGIKSTLGYYRDLNFLPQGREKAARAWAAGKDASAADARSFQDYIVYLLAKKAGEHDIVYEIHTGMRCFGSLYTKGNGPHELVELINANPDTRFDLFHSGYPWVWQASAMAKSIPNAYLSLNWLSVICETLTKNYLSESLDAVPYSKITWGGDCFYVEEAYAHCRMMRQILTEVLAEKAASGHYDLELCKEIAAGILRENAIALYGLKLPEDPEGKGRQPV